MWDKMSPEERAEYVDGIEDEVLALLKSKGISYRIATVVLDDVKEYLESCAWKNMLQ